MNKKIGIFASCFIALTLCLGGINEAQAKRFGGGSSFGSRPSYSQPYQREASPNGFNQPSRQSPAQQQATSQNQNARQSWANRGGLMGMLGGLALGGLLGSMFFGGAFESFNFMDIMIFALVAYLVYRLFTARQRQTVNSAYGRTSHNDQNNYGGFQDHQGGINTDILFKKDSNVRSAIPADFDQQGFLTGAERAFRHLQVCWDNRDLAAIRSLSTDKVFAEIQDQLRNSANNKTEILSLHAELLSVQEVGNVLEAAVLFDSVIREDDVETNSVKEVWHFIKPVNSQQTKWFLDGIQQVSA